MTYEFYTSNWNIKYKLILIYSTSNTFKVYSFEKLISLVIKSISISAWSIPNEYCDIADFIWKWYCDSDSHGLGFSFFLIFGCFTVLCLVVIFDQITTHVISIFIFSIGFILIVVIFFFNQRFLCGIGLNPPSREICFIQYFVFCYIFCGAFRFCWNIFRNYDLK